MARSSEDRKRATKKLRQDDARYHRISEVLTDYVYTVWVKKGAVVATDHGPACKAVTGYAAEELKSDPGLWLSMVAEDDRPAVLAQAAMVVAGKGLPAALEHRIRRKDGALRWIRNTPVPHYDRAGRLRFYDGIIQDITTRKRMEAEALQAQKIEALGMLSSGVAHDFNNILTMIIGFGSLMLDELKSDDPLASYAKDITRCAWLAASVTQQMLVLSRKQVARPQIVDINAVVIEMSKLLGRLIPSDVEVIRKLAPSAWVVKADITQLQQVLLNLVINARDAMPKGGKLTIITRNLAVLGDERPDLHITLPRGHYVCLEVNDTGVGMDKLVQERIFEPFFTTKGPGRGTGLGLSTIQNIVKECHGRISVESAAGQGAAFRIYIPPAEGMAATLLPRKDSSGLRDGNETILLVEDHSDLGRLVRKLLRTKGYRVLRAIRAADATAVSERTEAPIDLLLTDIVLPDMNGGELALRISAKRPGIKILYMSGYLDAALREMEKTPGSTLLEKPFAPEQLFRAVRAALSNRIDARAICAKRTGI